MAPGQKRVDLLAGGGECERVRAFFNRDTAELLHCSRVEDVDDARVANGDVEASAGAVKKHDIGWAAQGVPAQDPSRSDIKRDQLA